LNVALAYLLKGFKMHLKKLLNFVILVGVLFTNLAVANTFPNKSITIITSFPAGSGPDGYARPLVEELSRILKVPVVLDNRPGGGGVVSLTQFNNEPADAYHIYFTDPVVINNYTAIYGRDDLVKNIKMLTPGTFTNLVLITSTNINDAKDLTKAIQKTPLYGSYASGSPGQMYSIQLTRFLNLPSDLILYKDYSQWLLDISTQRLPYSFVTMASGKALEKAGKIKFLAVADNKRDPAYPDVPTVDELFGKKLGLEAPSTGAAFYIKKEISQEEEKVLRNAFRLAFTNPAVKEALESRNYKRWAPNAQDNEIENVMSKDAQLNQRLLSKFNIDIKQ